MLLNVWGVKMSLKCLRRFSYRVVKVWKQPYGWGSTQLPEVRKSSKPSRTSLSLVTFSGWAEKVTEINMNPELIGFSAGILTSINLLPQIYQSVKTRRVTDVSLWMLLIYDLGLGLWVTYGILISRPAIIFMDGAAFLASILMTYIKVKYSGDVSVSPERWNFSYSHP